MKLSIKIGKIIALELCSGTKLWGRVSYVDESEIILVPQAVGRNSFGQKLCLDDPNCGEYHIASSAVAMWQYVTASEYSNASAFE